MNQELKRIWMQYVKDFKFNVKTIREKYLIIFNGEFCNNSPVYECFNAEKSKYCEFYNDGNFWIAKNSFYVSKYKVKNVYFFNESFYNVIITPRLKYFDLTECKNFVNYKNKEILRTIFRCLLPKLNSDCIFMILSFIRRIDLGYLF